MPNPWQFWQLISAALPIGTFQYSQALETAIHEGWVHDLPSATDWLSGIQRESLARVDLPLAAAAFDAWQNQHLEQLIALDLRSQAFRETSELRAEERAMGGALRRWADAVDETIPDALEGFTALYAVVASNAGASKSDALNGLLWMWQENMTLVATKLVPLGHLQAQRMLRVIASENESLVAEALALAPSEWGSNTPGLLHLSAKHEIQPSRLFRS